MGTKHIVAKGLPHFKFQYRVAIKIFISKAIAHRFAELFPDIEKCKRILCSSI